MSSVDPLKEYLISVASYIGYGARFILLLLISFLIAALPLDRSQAKASNSDSPGPPINVQLLAASNYLTLSGREPKEISIDEAVRLIESGRARVVETQTPQRYSRAHISGSINLPKVDRNTISQLAGLGQLLVICDYQEQCELDMAARGIMSSCKLSASMMSDQLGYENVALVNSSYLMLRRKGVKFDFGHTSNEAEEL